MNEKGFKINSGEEEQHHCHHHQIPITEDTSTYHLHNDSSSIITIDPSTMVPNITSSPTSVKANLSSAYTFNGQNDHYVPKAPPTTTFATTTADSYQHPERFWVDYVMEASSKDHARVR